MKNVFKKGLVVLLASLFVTSVFAAYSTTAATTPAQKKAMVKHCVKHHHCNTMKTTKGKKACVKHCKKMMMKKAEATPAAAPAKKAA